MGERINKFKFILITTFGKKAADLIEYKPNFGLKVIKRNLLVYQQINSRYTAHKSWRSLISNDAAKSHKGSQVFVVSALNEDEARS